MHAALELRSLVGVAGLAVDLGDVVGMRIFLDVGVAVVALQAAVNAGTEFVAVDGDAVAGGVLHGLVAMAGQAIRLCGDAKRQQKCARARRQNGVLDDVE